MQRIPALDGLRAVAIVMVIGYHADRRLVPAGSWGVVLFFVLSGYLITRLLCAETDRDGHIDIRRFYLRRAFRLLPALMLVCLALLAIGTAWSQVIPALGYFANYARVAGVDMGPLTHTWSLAVEEHFYLLWPLLIGAVPARHRLRVVGLLAVVAVGWRVMAIGVMSPSWVYNATDTNAAALLAGCYLGVARLRAWPRAGWAVPTLLALMFLPVFGADGAGFAWGGFVAIGLGMIAIQHAAARPSWLETPVLVWLGKVSYGLYLWHYVYLRTELPIWAALALGVATAAASWYLVETPIRKLRERLEAPRLARHRQPLPQVAHLDAYRRLPRPVPVATARAAMSPLAGQHERYGAIGERRAGGFA
ncbi:MAG TPA: acyltransferase [Acidimicrobiia bacterium]|nr:acyltransferase [Acidimicrobiia bacterium]